MPNPTDDDATALRPSRQGVGTNALRPYGKYFLLKKLAEGGMAEIFLAKSLGLEGFERNVVIKRMLSHLTENPEFVSMFLDEARLAARLAHPNIVQITDLGLAEGCYFICMEYLAGEDLSTVLRTAARNRTFVPLRFAARVIADAAHGLHFAHEFADASGKPLKLVHRDVSPSNILVTYAGQVKVLDFGIAKAETRATNTSAGVVKGKYMYMAPEQADSREVDRRSDVYSLGVSLYEALSNMRPFARDTDLAILQAVLTSQFQPLREVRPDVPAELESIVVKAMQLRPEDRYATAGQMAAELERFIASSTSGSGGQSISEFMVGHFSADRVASRTKIATLEEMAREGVEIPGRDTGASTPASINDAPTTVARKSDPNVPVTRPSRTLAYVGVAAGIALGVGATWSFLRSASREVEAPAPVVETVRPADPRPAPPPVVVVPPPEPPAPALPDAGAPVAEEVAPVPAPAPARPIELTAGVVKARVQKQARGVLQCISDNAASLPQKSGALVVTVRIEKSGNVSSAVVDAPFRETPAGRCVEKVAKKLSFPPNVNAPTIRLPFAFKAE